MKKVLSMILAAVGMTTFFSYAEEIAQAPTPSMQTPMADCSQLTSSEQQFAQGLKSSNQMMFCNKMNQDQRNTAMQMVGQPDANGMMMTPDGSVEKVARDNNMMSPMKAPTMSPKGPGSSCPAK